MEQKKPEAQVAGTVAPPAAPPPGWVPLVDQNGAHVRIPLTPTVTEDDAEWLGVDPEISKPSPSSLFRMPGDVNKGGYIATTPPQVSEQTGGYWSEVKENAPGSLVGTAMGVAQTSNPITAGPATMQFGYQLATDPEFRKEVGTYYKNFLSVEGWAENFKKDPFGFSYDLITGAVPIKGAPKLPKPKAPLPKLKILGPEQLRKAGGKALDLAKHSGVYFLDDFVTNLQIGMKGGELSRNFRADRDGAAPINDVMRELDELPQRTVSFDDLQHIDQLLSSAWMKSKKAGDDYHAGVAGEMKATLNEYIDNVEKSGGEGLAATHDLTPARAAELYREGKAIYRQAMFARELDTIKRMSEREAYQFAQSGEANALRKHIRQLLNRHDRTGATGLRPEEYKALNSFSRLGIKDKFLKLLSRKASPLIGTTIGASVDAATGLPGVGSVAGTMAVGAMQEGAKELMNMRTVQQFNRFRQGVLAKGSQRLQGLLGEAVYTQLYGAPETAKVANRWVESIGTHAFTNASKSMAVAIASAARMNDKEAIDEIYARLIKMEDQVAMDLEVEDEDAAAAPQ